MIPTRYELDDDLVITTFPVALVREQRLVVDGKAVATAHETFMCPNRETLIQYIKDHAH